MGWLHWRFAAINVENRGNGNTWRIISPISDIPDIGDFIRRSRRSAKIAIAAPGTPADFRRSWRSAYKIARCVAGFREWRHRKIIIIIIKAKLVIIIIIIIIIISFLAVN